MGNQKSLPEKSVKEEPAIIVAASIPPEESPPLSPTPDKKEWKLDESSLWWLSLGVFQNPGNVLLISSIPFCAGAYLGYRQPTEKMEKLVGSFGTETSDASKEFGSDAERRLLGVRTAGRALRLGTLSSVGTFGILSATFFYALGFRTMDEAMERTTIWASAWRQGFEDFMSIDKASKNHPEVIATKHMTEDEEMSYIYEKYIKEPEETESSGEKTGSQPEE